MENLLVPYQAITKILCTRALVLAPHPDDEVFGCGGAIMRHVEQGVPVRVIVVSDGAYGASTEHAADYILTRQRESEAAAKVLRYGTPVFWHYRDREICYGEKLVQAILTAIDATRADLVYAPSVFEIHPDHRVLGMAAVEAVRRLGKAVQLALYEVGMPLRPNCLLDISDLAQRKLAAMQCFVSQNEKQRYDLDIAALNRYRTYTLPADVTAAEAYILISAEELANDPLKLYQSEHTRQKELGLTLDSRDTPLVSVIIRSMDRPTLSDTLDSIALQTYPHIEVVVVNAKGTGHREMAEWCGRFPLRLVGSDARLHRSRAANAGLEAAKGKYLIFLDDDDWFEAEHVEKLVQTIESHPDVKVVYSGVRCVDRDRNPLPTQFATPFDSTQLVAGNYIPIHAALFSKELLELGCRVDESLDLYEDWDFWIQASMFTDFLFVEGSSAVYRITQQSGFGVNANSMVAEKASLILFEKWLPRLQGDQLIKLMFAVRLNRIKDQQLKDQEQHIKNLDGLLVDKDEQLQDKDEQLQDKDEQLQDKERALQQMLSSTSWKITRPLRWLVLKGRWVRLQWRKVQESAERNGGLLVLADKAFLIVKREGVKGLKNKLVQFFHGDPAANGSDSYQEWIRRYDTLTDEARTTMCARIDGFPHKPLISVVMPTYNSKPEWLIEAIESVRKQIYPHWELCIADDASTDKTICTILERYAKLDARIKVAYRTQNGHISAASNSALELANGEWAALLDHDDLLSEHALFWVADAIQQNPDVRLIYSDEDKINEAGRRLNPYFKCDWNEDLFYSHNLITHLGVYRADLLKDIGGFRAGFEGAQDYDLALRCIERITPKQIHHIPRVLYHWRIHAESTAQFSDAKPYAMLAGERALNEHFQREKINAKAELVGYGYRLRYALPYPVPMVSLIIPTRNGLQLIRQCVESILKKTTYSNYEILIIDNGSDDPKILQYFDGLRVEARVRVVRDNRPFNYSALNNTAVKLARGEVVGLLNNDVEVISPEWLSEMVSIALQPAVGAVGARLWYPNDTLQHGGVILGIGGWAGHAHKGFPKGYSGYVGRMSLISGFTAVTGACLIVRKRLYEELGGLNEHDLQIACNDVDFCLRVREAGYRNVWTPYAELYHHESATRGFEDTPEKQARFAKEVQYMKQRWGALLLNDPAYSPNLTLDHQDFSLAWPPRVKPLAG